MAAETSSPIIISRHLHSNPAADNSYLARFRPSTGSNGNPDRADRQASSVHPNCSPRSRTTDKTRSAPAVRVPDHHLDEAQHQVRHDLRARGCPSARRDSVRRRRRRHRHLCAQQPASACSAETQFRRCCRPRRRSARPRGPGGLERRHRPGARRRSAQCRRTPPRSGDRSPRRPRAPGIGRRLPQHRGTPALADRRMPVKPFEQRVVERDLIDFIPTSCHM